MALGAVQGPGRGERPLLHVATTLAAKWTGTAKDGKPKFDLDSFDQAYFDRLRERVIAAGSEGIYVSVMLFEGFSLHLTAPPDNIEGHRSTLRTSTAIGITSINDYQVLPLDPRVQALQEAYMRAR